ncbi:hypothetical protein WJX84_001997 [Apatococcus fuscideae]|uniref:Chromo domain-containing protein n=1 Tax=Apatococcus fuscideae TaxID=2026836 RepID=A0AAW1T3S6_9CHLO
MSCGLTFHSILAMCCLAAASFGAGMLIVAPLPASMTPDSMSKMSLISRRAFGTTIQSVNETLENGLPSPEHEEAYEDLDPRSRAAYLRWLVKQPAYEEPIVAASADLSCYPNASDPMPYRALDRQYLFNIYVHSSPSFEGFPDGNIFGGLEINDRVEAAWGSITLIDALRNLLAAALEDPLNQKMVLVSETGIPLFAPQLIYSQLILEQESRLNSCSIKEDAMRRWINEMAISGVVEEGDFRKSSQWVALKRKHAGLVVSDTALHSKFRDYCFLDTRPTPMWRDCYADEHYIPTLIAAAQLGHETDCVGQLTNVFWESDQDAHPKSYVADDVSEELIAHLRPSACNNHDAALRSAQASLLDMRFGEPNGDFCSAEWPHPDYVSDMEPACTLFARKFTSEADGKLLEWCNCGPVAPACTSGRQHQLSKVPSKAKLAAGHLFNDSHGSHSSPAALRVLKDEAEQPLIGFGEVVEVADLKGVRVLVKKGQPEVQYLVAWKDDAPDTWEPMANIAENLIRDFEDKWWAACRKGDEAAIMGMLHGDGRVLANALDENRRSGLHFAAAVGNPRCARLLLKAGADVDVTDKEGYTPLHMASGYFHTATVQVLLEAGADPSLEDRQGRDPVRLIDNLREATPLTN